MLVSKLRLEHPGFECQPHRSCIHPWDLRNENLHVELEAMVGMEEQVAQVAKEATVALDPQPWHLLGMMAESRDRTGLCYEPA